MKKLMTISAVIAAAAMMAVSCQQEIEQPADEPAARGVLTATFEKPDATKVTYTETAQKNLQPRWEVGDIIVGTDDSMSEQYFLTVKSVNSDTAVLECKGTPVPDNGRLHLIYKKNLTSNEIDSRSILFDNQTGDIGSMRALMLADGDVKDGNCAFKFRNACAVIGIRAMNGLPQGTVISGVVIVGSNLYKLNVGAGASGIEAIAQENEYDSIIIKPNSVTVTDEDGTLSSPLFVAVPGGAVIRDLVVLTGDLVYGGNDHDVLGCNNDFYFYCLSSSKTLEASTYAYVSDQEFEKFTIGDSCSGDNHPHAVDLGLSVKWSCMNIGSEEPQDYGRYFKFGDVEGQTWDGTSWSGDGGSNPEESQLLEYVDDGNLKPEYDAAHVLWGDGWRMPTWSEYLDLKNSCLCLWTDDFNGTGVAGCYCISTLIGYAGKYIFIPASGTGEFQMNYFMGSGAELRTKTFDGQYKCFGFGVWTDRLPGYLLSIRPVKD